jgi:uncharacterized protein YcaQ
VVACLAIELVRLADWLNLSEVVVLKKGTLAAALLRKLS